MTKNTSFSFTSKLSSVLGCKKEKLSENDIRVKIHEGFPFSVFIEVRKEINLSQKELSVILEINEQTLARRKESQRFNSLESDRLYRLIHILLYTYYVFEDIYKAQTWLKRPNRSIGNYKPINLLNTDIGTAQVENVLRNIEHGIYS